MRFSNMLFFLCFSPTIKFQDGSPVDHLFEPLADPPLLTRPLKNYFYRHFGVSEFLSRILTALTEVCSRDIRANEPRMSVGYLARKLALWAASSFLRWGRSEIPRFCSKLQLFALVLGEKRRKTKKSEEKRRKKKRKKGKFLRPHLHQPH